MEQVQDILKRLDELRKRPPSAGDTDIAFKGFHFNVGQAGKESIIDLEIDLTITPKQKPTSQKQP